MSFGEIVFFIILGISVIVILIYFIIRKKNRSVEIPTVFEIPTNNLIKNKDVKILLNAGYLPSRISNRKVVFERGITKYTTQVPNMFDDILNKNEI